MAPASESIKIKIIMSAVIGVLGCGEAKAGVSLLSCSGTVQLIQEGKQTNPENETSLVSIMVDIPNRTLSVEGEAWPITGKPSSDTIVAVAPDRGSATLNRITGAVTVHSIEIGLKIFTGVCKPAHKLF